MKNIKISIFILAAVFTFAAAQAQIDRSTPPEPGPPPLIQIGDYESFELENGLKVFVVENNKIPRVSYSLVVDYDPVYEGEQAGYVGFTGQLLGTATTTKTKAQIDQEIDFIGASLNTSANSIFASSLKKHNDKLLEIMSDVILNPVFKEEELDKIKKQTISGLTASKEDPNSISARVRNKILFGADHPYGELVTEETANSVDLEKCRQHYEDYFVPNLAYLAIVGDITVKEAKKQVKKYFGEWEKGDLFAEAYPDVEKPEGVKVSMVDRPSSVQSVIAITHPVQLNVGYDDYVPARVANTMLGGGTYRLFFNLRETHGYTYGSYSRLSGDELVGSFLAFADVANAVTDSAIHEILYEMDRLQNEPIPEEELQRVKNNMTGNFALSLERPETVARFALNTARYNLPEDYYATYLQKIDAVTPAQINEMAGRYLSPENTHIFVVGKADEVAPTLTKFASDGEVHFLNFNGEPYDPAARELPAGLTADEVIADYVEAIGGEKQLNDVNSMKLEMTMSMQGMALKVEQYQKRPNMYASIVTMNGNVMQKQVFDGESGRMSGMQGEQEMEGEMLEEMKIQAILFPETRYDELGYGTILNGIEEVDGNDAYVVEVTSPSGTKSIHYFDTESGLKVKTSATMNTQMGEMVQTTLFDNYQEVNGIQVPYSMTQSVGPQSFDITVENVTLNEDIEDSVFK